MANYDLLIKSGTIIDGQRTPRYMGDIAITDGRIAQIGGGLSESNATRVVDAKDLIVAPGFIDLHTHFDSQIFCNIKYSLGLNSAYGFKRRY